MPKKNRPPERTDSPRIVALGGPNGAGKSTLAPALLRDRLGIRDFVNADVVARGLSAFDPEGAAIAAGRVLLRRLDDLVRARTSFAFESTLSSRRFAAWLAGRRADGYRVHLAFVWVGSAELAVARVAGRVRAGGHSIPSDTVHRRYHRSIANFVHLYLQLADTWRIYDNSGAHPRTIAKGRLGTAPEVRDAAAWQTIRDEAAVSE